MCKDISPTSVCDPQRQRCVIPCKSQADCYNGICTAERCEGLSDEKEQKQSALLNVCSHPSPLIALQCTLAKIDPYLAVLVANEIEASSTPGSLVDKFVEMITESSCSTEGGNPIEDGNLSREECLEWPGFCKVLANKIGSPSIGRARNGLPPQRTEGTTPDI